jgi:ribonuclease BN (tRNA processing enzyme)
MKLILTGTASGIPVTDRKHSSTLLGVGGQYLLIDAGEGTASAMIAAAVPYDAVGAVCITHTHADHVSGLPMLLQGMHLARRSAPLNIFVPTGREDWFRAWLIGLYMFPEKWSFPMRLHPLEDTVLFDGALRLLPLLDRVRELAARHGIRAQSFSIRLEGPDASVLISSDIAGIQDIARHAPRVDLLVVDATHVPLTEIVTLVRENPELRVVCTHIPPELEKDLPDRMDAATAAYPDRMLFAYDGMELELMRDRTWK